MQICRRLAGYSYARADIVRRAMSKKDEAVMKAERKNFLDGCEKNGIPKDAADEIFGEMVGFAKYAFNKSHATAYGVISYRTAYLKANFPAEYFSALLTSVLSDTNKLREYIADAQRAGVNVLPPNINSSGADFTVDGSNIRYGLLAIKNVGRQFADAIIKERSKKPFSSFDDFVSRIAGNDINKRTAESLIKCGVFDSLGVTRSSLMSCYEGIIDSEQERLRKNISGQLDLFSIAPSSVDTASNSNYEYPAIPEYSLKELLLLEKESSGMYFSGHMIDNYSEHIKSLGVIKISELIASNEDASTKYKERDRVKIAGIITAKKIKVIKNGDSMAFIKLEDRYGEIEVIVFSKQYSRFASELFNENAVVIDGTISYEDGDDAKILMTALEVLKSNSEFCNNELII